ncbi:MAG: hypothetical protein HY868_24520 [Chloroflexi bacterium]|nr:hypothetical protein [Chloroflexota bacterium]
MFGSTIIDVAIGLIFVYFLLSTISSKINDLIAGWMQWRAKDLAVGIRTLLADPQLTTKVLSHPLVQGLTGKEGKALTYIPANTFALAFFDAIAPAANEPTGLDKVRASAMQMPDSSVRQAVISIVDAANGNMVQARNQVETWFNSAMDRVSLVYRQRIQVLTVFVALAVTLIFGADSLAIGNSLWREPGLRAAVSGAAQGAQSGAFQQAVNTLSQSALPIGWNTLPATPLEWFQKILGLILTTLAVSLGAPFWYDLLRNLTSLISSKSK